MKKNTIVFLSLMCLFLSNSIIAQKGTKNSSEPYRPRLHFTPKAHWVNDPNGMVYYKNTYHLFFQYYPDSTVWGPMHWGHATSKDMINWKEQPVALYPDSLGYIFSGSAVVDKNNTSGFGKNGKAPLVAIFTHHDPVGEKAGINNFQNQSIAYSLDDGKSWTKYSGNPVLHNPGVTDFRDPKVMWYEQEKKWVMTLATKDRITFYSSPNLKDWTKESEFGQELGAHGGVWECPDLFTLNDNGKKVWVLIVNLNPGGPNGGSATQYFIGDFDGKTFTANHTDTRWIDYGPDEYAGITWSNTGDRKIFLGWMSNWQYAQVVPTKKWRSAMTIPRELKLKHVGDKILIASEPVVELSGNTSKSVTVENVTVSKKLNIKNKVGSIAFPYRINLNIENGKEFSFVLANKLGEKIVIGYDAKENRYYIDRTRSGKVDFQKDFAGIHTAPRFVTGKMDITLVVDVSSVEMFADNGLTTMTEIFFPTIPYDQFYLQAKGKLLVKKLESIQLKRMPN